METNDIREELAAAERAQATPFVNYPSIPWWYPVLTGLWAASMVFAVYYSLEREEWIGFAVMAVALAALVGFMRWYQTRWGTWPRMEKAPREIRAAYAFYFVGYAVLIAVIALVYWLINPWVAMGLAFVATTGFIWAYEQRYAQQAAKLRERLSIPAEAQ